MILFFYKLTCTLLYDGTRHGVCSVLLPRSSASKDQAHIVKKPTVFCVLDNNGILSLDESCMALNKTQAEPNGIAV